MNIYKPFPAGYQGHAGTRDGAQTSPLDPGDSRDVKAAGLADQRCAYCVDMLYKNARAAGETEEGCTCSRRHGRRRVHRCRTGGAGADQGDHADRRWPRPRRRRIGSPAAFDAETYAALGVLVAINAWNRLAITSHSPSGIYQPRITANT